MATVEEVEEAKQKLLKSIADYLEGDIVGGDVMVTDSQTDVDFAISVEPL